MPRKPDLSAIARGNARRAAQAARQRSLSTSKGSAKAKAAKAAAAAARAEVRTFGKLADAGRLPQAQAERFVREVKERKLPLPQRRAAESARSPARSVGLAFDDDGQIDGHKSASLAALRFAPSEGQSVLGGHYVVSSEQPSRFIAYVVDDKGKVRGATPMALSAEEAQAMAEDLATIQKYRMGASSLSLVIVPLARTDKATNADNDGEADE